VTIAPGVDGRHVSTPSAYLEAVKIRSFSVISNIGTIVQT
jgi:hypothetical protein